MKIKPHFIIGLGNPGSRYASTYHNVGFLAVDYFAKNPSISNFNFQISKQIPKFQNPKSKNFEYLKINGLILIKPLVFMNESGKAVAASLKYFSARAGEILVIHDDSDIKFGKMKLSFGRGAAGHHGVESIISNLKTKNFWRLRIGIRPEASSVKRQASSKKAGEFVLKKITPADKLVWERLFSDLKIL